MKYQTSDFRNGLKIELDNNPYVMTYFQFVKPGKGTAFTRTKLKHMISGSVIERTFRSGETVEAADVEEREMEYLYNDGEFFHFMNTETFAQVRIPETTLGDDALFLTENIQIQVLFYKGVAANIELPNFIESEITYCEPGVKGNTATGATKPATITPGAIVQVPLFVEQNERIRIDTRTKAYVSRVK
ncbi:MAG: elongation factor P [Myxococcota bacterium]